MLKPKLIYSLILFAKLGHCQVDKDPIIEFIDSRGNYVYIGVNNRIKLNIPNFKLDHFSFSCRNCMVTQEDKYISYKVLHTGFDTVRVISKNDSNIYYTQLVFARRVPDPSIAINGVELKKEVSKLILASADRLEGFLDVDLVWLEHSFKVTSFVLLTTSGATAKSMKANSDLFTKEMKTAINTLSSGDRITFKKVLVFGPDGTTRYLGHDINLKIL